MNPCFANGVAIQLRACGVPPKPAPWDNKISGYFPCEIGASSLAGVPTKKTLSPSVTGLSPESAGYQTVTARSVPRSLEGAPICRTPTNSLAAAEWCTTSGETVQQNKIAIFITNFIEFPLMTSQHAPKSLLAEKGIIHVSDQ